MLKQSQAKKNGVHCPVQLVIFNVLYKRENGVMEKQQRHFWAFATDETLTLITAALLAPAWLLNKVGPVNRRRSSYASARGARRRATQTVTIYTNN